MTSLQSELSSLKTEKEKEINTLHTKSVNEFEKVKESHKQEIEWLQSKIQGLQSKKNIKVNDSRIKMDESNSVITEQSNIHDLSGSISQDLRMIAYWKSQELENVELKNKIQQLNSRLKELAANYNWKLNKKNEKIASLEKQLSDLRESFNVISGSMKEMNIRASQLERAWYSGNSWITIKRPPTDEGKDISIDDSVIFKTKDRYATPNKTIKECKTEYKRVDTEITGNRRCTPYDTYAVKDSQFLTPNQFLHSGNKSEYIKQMQTYDENVSNKTDWNNWNDLFLKSTMYKLEATESKNNYLTMQKRFVKKALAKLTDKLCNDEDDPQEDFKIDIQMLKSQTEYNTADYRHSDIPTTPKGFWRLSITDQNNPETLESQGEDSEPEEDICLKPFFRENSLRCKCAALIYFSCGFFNCNQDQRVQRQKGQLQEVLQIGSRNKNKERRWRSAAL